MVVFRGEGGVGSQQCSTESGIKPESTRAATDKVRACFLIAYHVLQLYTVFLLRGAVEVPTKEK